MRLVLVDTWAVESLLFSRCQSEYSTAYYMQFSVKAQALSTSESRNSANQYKLSNDESGANLVREIVDCGGTEGLSILFPTTFPMNTGWVVAIWDVFRSLLNQCDVEDGVRISVCLECLTRDNLLLEIASVEDMRIDCRNYICGGTGSVSGKADTELYCQVENQMEPKVHLKLVADVPEKLKWKIKTEQSNSGVVSRSVLEEGSFSDVVIIASNGIEFKAHKCFLSVCSPVLKKMFETDMKESQTGRLEMTDVSEQGVQAFLRYLYYGDTKRPKDDVEIAFELLRVSHMYEVRNLEAEMIWCLMERANDDFTVELAFKIYMLTRNVETLADVKRKTVQILKINVDELESLDEYKKLFKDNPNVVVVMEVFKDFVKSF